MNHGKRSAIQRLKAGDRLVMYSPRIAYPDGAPLQAFTAIGTVISGEVYQVEMSPGFTPHRVDVAFESCQEALIKPLVEQLSFIKNKQHWGAAFRFGYLSICEADFRLIESAMCCSGHPTIRRPSTTTDAPHNTSPVTASAQIVMFAASVCSEHSASA